MTVAYIDLVAQHAPFLDDLTAAARRVLEHGQFILGPEVEAFEHAVAEYLDARHVVAVASGTDALRLALRVHEIGPGDEVITVSHSFVGTVAAIASVGASPTFVDVHPDTLTMDPARIEAALTERTKAVIPVHLSGTPCDLDAITEVCERRNLILVEDCAQAIGARYRDRMIGAKGTGCFSLHPIKSLGACGDAGFLTFEDPDLARQARTLANNGLVDRDRCVALSPHSRLDTLQAALLLVKLPHLEGWLHARRAHAGAYRAALSRHFEVPTVLPETVEAPTAFVIRTRHRDALLRHAALHGFDLKVHYPIPIHLQPALHSLGVHLPVTELIVDEIVSLPVRPELSATDRDALIECLLAFDEQTHV